MNDTNHSDVFGPIIYSYSRAQAIADGVLVDVTTIAQETGFKFPVALTRAVWSDCIEWSESDSKRKGGWPQDEAGRLWDVLWMAKLAARRGGQRIAFQVLRVPREGRGFRPRLVTLVAHCGPGDNGEPVITIKQPNED